MKVIYSIFLTLGVLAFSGIFALADLIEVVVDDDVGGLYEIEELDRGIKVFSDRDHILKEVPGKYTDGSYTFIRCPVKSVRETKDIDITFNLPVPCRVYILWYKQGDWAKPHDPSDWLKKSYKEVEEDIFIWGAEGGQGYNYIVWQSKEVFPAGEFHTYSSDNDCAYTVFIKEEFQAVEAFDKSSVTWGHIKKLP